MYSEASVHPTHQTARSPRGVTVMSPRMMAATDEDAADPQGELVSHTRRRKEERKETRTRFPCRTCLRHSRARPRRPAARRGAQSAPGGSGPPTCPGDAAAYQGTLRSCCKKAPGANVASVKTVFARCLVWQGAGARASGRTHPRRPRPTLALWLNCSAFWVHAGARERVRGLVPSALVRIMQCEHRHERTSRTTGGPADWRATRRIGDAEFVSNDVRRVDVSWAQRVNAYALGTELAGHAACHLEHGRLGGVVRYPGVVLYEWRACV